MLAPDTDIEVGPYHVIDPTSAFLVIIRRQYGLAYGNYTKMGPCRRAIPLTESQISLLRDAGWHRTNEPEPSVDRRLWAPRPIVDDTIQHDHSDFEYGEECVNTRYDQCQHCKKCTNYEDPCAVAPILCSQCNRRKCFRCQAATSHCSNSLNSTNKDVLAIRVGSKRPATTSLVPQGGSHRRKN